MYDLKCMQPSILLGPWDTYFRASLSFAEPEDCQMCLYPEQRGLEQVSITKTSYSPSDPDLGLSSQTLPDQAYALNSWVRVLEPALFYSGSASEIKTCNRLMLYELVKFATIRKSYGLLESGPEFRIPEVESIVKSELIADFLTCGQSMIKFQAQDSNLGSESCPASGLDANDVLIGVVLHQNSSPFVLRNLLLYFLGNLTKSALPACQAKPMGKHGSNKPNQEGISAQNKIRSLRLKPVLDGYIPETKRNPQENAFLDLVSYYGNLPGAGMSNFVLVFDHNLRKQGEMEDGIKPRSSTCLSLPLLIWLIDPTFTACLILVIKAHSWSTGTLLIGDQPTSASTLIGIWVAPTDFRGFIQNIGGRFCLDNKPMDYKLLRPAQSLDSTPMEYKLLRPTQGLIAISDLIASRQISIRQGLGVRVLNSERCPSWITEPIIKANFCYPRVYPHMSEHSSDATAGRIPKTQPVITLIWAEGSQLTKKHTLTWHNLLGKLLLSLGGLGQWG
ncbi:hypothetical protein VNO77_31601 [Canavalia gladiata]|uniref:Uncharacterized protein n=1 Tax=Canavalia gladiata TaxID=3824 RepID=A0AAN9KPS9_CANGL